MGYDALIIFDRVLKKNKPFWRGLDGTCIVLDGCFLQPPEPNLRTADCVKLPACPVCRGKGCALCEGTGIDTSYDMTRCDKELLQGAYYGNMTADVFLEKLLETEKDEYFVMITTEEPRIGDFLYGPLKEAAQRHGMEVHYLGFEENHDLWCAGQVERLRAGDIPEDLIERRGGADKEDEGEPKDARVEKKAASKADDAKGGTQKPAQKNGDEKLRQPGKNAMKKVHALLRLAWDKYQDAEGYVNIGAAGSYIKRARPDFDVRSYGYHKLPQLIEAFPDRYNFKTSKKGHVFYRCI